MNGWTKSTTYLAVTMLVGGFLLIVLAWNGAASLDYVQGQIPYLISGGLAGVGLIVGGVTLALVQEMRRSTAMLAARLDRLTGLLSTELGDHGSENLPAPRVGRDDTAVIERVGASSSR